jgi:hexosaminidase
MGQTQAALNLMPQPAQFTVGEGRLLIDGGFQVALTGVKEPTVEAAVKRMIARLSNSTGIPLTQALATEPAKATMVVQCGRLGGVVQKLNDDESYSLEITTQQAHLSAATTLGILRGLETFLQLVDLDAHGFGVPAVRIEDRPRFPWRGLLLDVSRHWMPIEVVKRNLDGMAAVKLNVFHWHLSDDQGFRVESKVFPKLQQIGSDGNYYTQAQVKEVIAYAHERGIRVVPEFDVPAHTSSWLAAYPALGSGPGPYEIGRHWGVYEPTMDPTREYTYRFLDRFIGEMAALFPDEYFHVGGDELNSAEWRGNRRIQAFMRHRRMKTAADLQTYFNQRLVRIVERHGKKMVGWDEVLRPGLPKDVVVQSWRGPQSLAAAAQQGYRGILSAGYYLDLMQPASQHYQVDPLGGAAAALSEQDQSRILGGEACMWAELVTPMNVDSRIWPRLAAIAEKLWSPKTVTDIDSMYQRLAVVSRQLEFIGLAHRSSGWLMLKRLTGPHPADSLARFDEVLEPVKGYAREKARQYTSLTPMNRLVDATLPESDAARQFAVLAADWKTNANEIERRLAEWRDSAINLLPMTKENALLEEQASIAENVRGISQAGIEALTYLRSDKAAPADWVKRQLDLLDTAAQPNAELLIVIVPSIRLLVQTAQAAQP